MGKKIKIPKLEKLEKYNNLQLCQGSASCWIKKSYDKLKERDLEV